MVEFKSRLLQGTTLVLIMAAGFVVVWLPQYDAADRSMGRRRSIGVVIDNGFGTPEEEITYRFLYRDEAGTSDEWLTLGRSVGRDLEARAVWGFTDIEQWYDAAPEILACESGWIVEQQPGWKVSRWLCLDEVSDCDRDRLFWMIQTLRLFDLEVCTKEITMLEATGRTIRIYPTEGPSNYDYDADTLYWNPTETVLVPSDTDLNWRWFQTDPLVTLARGLSCAWHDLCDEGDAASCEERERMAITTENRIRYLLFRKDPMGWRLYPRPGYREIWPDLPGDSAAEAWQNYRGVIKY
ncbi:MAG: hypothetical protein JSW27_11360 [Phycisphaerales bacterium]|nr:MAG: hypothetical protein JSW27_11360 [Phycisphaerales bacterium]